MKILNPLSVVAVVVLLAACTSTRSISNSTYREPGTATGSATDGASDAAFAYRGELSEFDVLGVARDQTAFDDDIQVALEKARPVRLKPGSTLLLIQSGAAFPDGPIIDELGKHFTVVPFSGVPPQRDPAGATGNPDNAGFSRSLRLAAARAGAETIACCWGVVESGRERIATRTVSWVPVVTWFVPDEREQMRIRLKLALIDVRTGDWAVVSPPPCDSRALSWGTRRAVADRKLVERLKTVAYESCVREMLRIYSGEPLSAKNSGP